MRFEFSIRDDINVRSRSLNSLQYEDYNKEDIARAVAFYLDMISNCKYEKIAVGFGGVSLLSVAFLLALHKSGKEYTVVYHDGTFNFKDHKDLYPHLFFTGAISNGDIGRRKIDSIIAKEPDRITLTDTPLIETFAFSYYKKDDLIFDYSKNKKINVVIANTIGLLYTTEKIEGSSIQAAMDNYFVPDDYAVIMRPFQHIGVGTLSIYPAFFKVKNITLCPFADDWQEEYHNATIVHIDQHMMREKCDLPKKLRMLTSGGYHFNSECIEYVTSRSDIENIVDCFGTAKCPPPLAIRDVKNQGRFIWINKFVKPSVISDTRQMVFTTIEQNVFDDNGRTEIITNDVVDLNDDKTEFSFVGNFVDKIRMSHSLYPVTEFKKLFEEYSGIKNFSVYFEILNGLKNPVIQVDKDDFDQANDTLTKFHVEAKLKIK